MHQNQTTGNLLIVTKIFLIGMSTISNTFIFSGSILVTSKKAQIPLQRFIYRNISAVKKVTLIHKILLKRVMIS